MTAVLLETQPDLFKQRNYWDALSTWQQMRMNVMDVSSCTSDPDDMKVENNANSNNHNQIEDIDTDLEIETETQSCKNLRERKREQLRNDEICM